VSFDPEFLRVSVVKFCLSDQCHPCLSVVSFWFPILNFGNYPILAISAISSHPARPFFRFCRKQRLCSKQPKHGPCEALGWPLGATQAPPKPNPNRQRVAGRAVRRKPGTAIPNLRAAKFFKELAHLGAASRYRILCGESIANRDKSLCEKSYRLRKLS
jgi:hypothetical protein